jgi:hypothetical protein
LLTTATDVQSGALDSEATSGQRVAASRFFCCTPDVQVTGKSTVWSNAEPVEFDPNLATVNAAWPTLPTGIRAAITAMVKAVDGTK